MFVREDWKGLIVGVQGFPNAPRATQWVGFGDGEKPERLHGIDRLSATTLPDMWRSSALPWSHR